MTSTNSFLCLGKSRYARILCQHWIMAHIPHRLQLAVMKALVDYQVCLSGEIIKNINASYGHETAGELAKKAKERKEQREKEQKEKEAEQPAETGKEEAANDKGKAPEKPKQTRAPREKPQDVQNNLAITSIGTDSRKHVWYRIDGKG